ncbi:MAG: hypothetical protein AAFX39_08320, partial [Pseudomonadota bacterium]
CAGLGGNLSAVGDRLTVAFVNNHGDDAGQWITFLAASLPSFIVRMPGAWLRLTAFALLWLALLSPEFRREERDPLPGVVAVIVDESDSQSIADRTEITAQARALLEDRLASLPEFELRLVTAGRDQADGTELFGSVIEALADVPAEQVAGVVLVTDGRIHDAPDVAAALGIDAPIHTLLTGHEDEADRRVVLEATPRFGIVGELKEVTFRLAEEGPLVNPAPDGRVEIRIRRDGQLITTQRVLPETIVSIPIEIARGGRNLIEIEADTAPNELTAVNNRAVLSVEGIRENLRVLLVSGEPHAGERTWRNILKSDAAVDLVHFTILRPPEKQDGTPISQLSLIAFPTRELFQEKIGEFDLIIFDRYQRRGVLPISYFDNIARYVENGGALLVAAGPDLALQGSLARTPLASVLPVVPTGRMIEEPYYPVLSEVGFRHPITEGLDGSEQSPPNWSRWFRMVDANVERGNVLMTGPGDRPLLMVNREGEGRVAMLLSDHAWLWARGYEGGGPYVQMLRRLGHWLMQETDLEEEALEAISEGNGLTIERRTLGETVDPVTVIGPDGEIRETALEEVRPGVFRGQIPVDGFGLYTVQDSDIVALASVGPLNPREFAEVTSSDQVVRPLATETRAGVFRLVDAQGGDVSVPRVVPMRATTTMAGSDWMGLRRSSASALAGVSATPILAGLAGLLLLIGALGTTWWREGR